jgi:hypothetical protein
MPRTSAARLAALLLLVAMGARAEIAAPKLELIKRAMAAMKVDARIHGLVAARVEGKVQAIRAQNSARNENRDSGVSDSLLAVARSAIAGAYADHLEGPDGLFPRVHAVLDRRLSAEDLRFVADFHGSDEGRRYREAVPRIVAECVEEGRLWAERLEPEVRARLEDALRGTDVKF